MAYEDDLYSGISDDELKAEHDPIDRLVEEILRGRCLLIELHEKRAVIPRDPNVLALIEALMRICNWYDVVRDYAAQLGPAAWRKRGN